MVSSKRDKYGGGGRGKVIRRVSQCVLGMTTNHRRRPRLAVGVLGPSRGSLSCGDELLDGFERIGLQTLTRVSFSSGILDSRQEERFHVQAWGWRQTHYMPICVCVFFLGGGSVTLSFSGSAFFVEHRLEKWHIMRFFWASQVLPAGAGEGHHGGVLSESACCPIPWKLGRQKPGADQVNWRGFFVKQR